MYAMPRIVGPLLIKSDVPIEQNKYYINREEICKISAQYGVDLGVATTIYINRDTKPPDEKEVHEWYHYITYHTI